MPAAGGPHVHATRLQPHTGAGWAVQPVSTAGIRRGEGRRDGTDQSFRARSGLEKALRHEGKL